MADNSMSTSEAGTRGGHAQGKENNPGNFANRSEEDRKEAASRGAKAQPHAAKVEGGKNSHRGREQ